MSSGRIGVGYGAVPVGVAGWLGVGLGLGIDPVVAVSLHIDVGIVAPSAAMVLKNVPSRSVGIKPSLVPTGVWYISRILSVKGAAGIPLIKPDVSSPCRGHPQRQGGIEIAAGHSAGGVGDIELVGSNTTAGDDHLIVGGIGCSCLGPRGSGRISCLLS